MLLNEFLKRQFGDQRDALWSGDEETDDMGDFEGDVEDWSDEQLDEAWDTMTDLFDWGGGGSGADEPVGVPEPPGVPQDPGHDGPSVAPQFNPGDILDPTDSSTMKLLREVGSLINSNPWFGRMLKRWIGTDPTKDSTLSPLCTKIALQELPQDYRRAVVGHVCGWERPFNCQSNTEARVFSAIKLAKEGTFEGVDDLERYVLNGDD